MSSSLGVTVKPQMRHRQVRDAGSAAQKSVRQIYNPFSRQYEPTPVWDGHALGEGHQIEGQAVVELATTTIVIPVGYVLNCNDNFLMQAV